MKPQDIVHRQIMALYSKTPKDFLKWISPSTRPHFPIPRKLIGLQTYRFLSTPYSPIQKVLITNNNHTFLTFFHLSQQYNFKTNTPLYDPYTNKYLHLYWRTNKIIINPIEVEPFTNPTSTLNIDGTQLEICSNDPQTGFYRNGYCHTGPEDTGTHTVCTQVTTPFLDFSKQRGNDLITPSPKNNFPGLKNGDYWCLCANRYKEAIDANIPLVVKRKATHQKTNDIIGAIPS
jgi:uncharacterized protein (DUF2237 family)